MMRTLCLPQDKSLYWPVDDITKSNSTTTTNSNNNNNFTTTNTTNNNNNNHTNPNPNPADETPDYTTTRFFLALDSLSPSTASHTT
ncbi:hypothetical protein KC363_g5347, partial [Hortaea werneckii]